MAKKRQRAASTTADALGSDVLCMIFAFLDLVQLIRCSAVCKSWSTVIHKLKLLQIQYHKNHRSNSGSSGINEISLPERLINIQIGQLAMERQRLSLQGGSIDVFQWKAHPVGINQCRMKMGLILSGVGDKVMRLWSAESCKQLDEYSLPDKASLIDFDFDEGKVVGLVGSRMCIWRRTGNRGLFSSREGLFTRGLCMRYVDPHAVVGCEDGRVRVFDMYSRKISQIIKMHPGAVSSLSFTDEQLIVSGSSYGSISMSDLSSDQNVATLATTSSTGIKTLCLNPSSYKLFAGSGAGYASCWDLRTRRRLWEKRVCPNVIYAANHLRGDKMTLVVGGIDGVLKIIDQDSGEILSRCVVEENRNVSDRSTVRIGAVERMKGRRVSEDERIDLIRNKTPISCLAVGMQKVVTVHRDRCVRLWKFRDSK